MNPKGRCVLRPGMNEQRGHGDVALERTGHRAGDHAEKYRAVFSRKKTDRLGRRCPTDRDRS